MRSVPRTDTTPKRRLCFADGKRTQPPPSGNRAFYNFLMPADRLDRPAIIQILGRFADQGFITRAYGLDEQRRWDQGQQGRANILATDRVTKKKWARVGCKPFEQRDGPRSKNMEC